MIPCSYLNRPRGHFRSVIRVDVFRKSAGRARGHTLSIPTPRRMHAMANSTDPFSASIIPFEVPEQMRAFAEKGVSQARDNYARFKDVAESHNGTMEVVFTTASKGASEFSAKLIEIVKANTTANLDFAQSLFGVKSPSEAIELWTSHARKQFETFTANAKELAELTQRVSA